MASLELSLKYQAVSKEVMACVFLGWTAMGVVLVLLVHALFTWIGFFKPSPGFQVIETLFFLACTFGYVFVPFTAQMKYFNGNHIFASSDGLGLPASLFGSSQWLPWSELKLLELVGSHKRPTLVLKFSSRPEIYLHTERMQEQDVEQLLMAVEAWAVNAIWSERLSDWRDALQNRKVGLADGYTKLWEEELHRRFNCTTFVPLEPGIHIRSGSLKIIRQIAFGGFSAVYLAEDTNRHQLVLKESATAIDSPSHDKALQMFRREASLLAELNHDRIAHVEDNFVENGRTYLVLEYVPGENLREYVKRNGRCDEKTVLGFMAQMAAILEYLHSQDPPIIHRDFTPDNLVLRHDGSLVLVDFGAANQFIGTATGTLVGKQCYMPAEQVRGKTTPRSDLYALGCTAHFLLTGKDPEPLSLCHPRFVNNSVSAALDKLISELTEQEEPGRPDNARDVAVRLAAIQSEIDHCVISLDSQIEKVAQTKV